MLFTLPISVLSGIFADFIPLGDHGFLVDVGEAGITFSVFT
jgi:hypothetical protein